MLLVLLLVASALRPALAALPFYPATDPRLQWLGRTLSLPSGSVAFDLEGTTLSFSVANASYIGLNITDATRGGARIGVYLNSNGPFSAGARDPNPAGRAIPGARVAVLLTSPHQALYTLGSGDQIRGLGPRGVRAVRAALLSEWSMTGDSAGALLAVDGVFTDGVLMPAPPRPARRLLVLGDSLSSGVGAGFTVPPSGAPCGAGVAVDDWGQTWNALLCANFSAECEVLAQSGVTITANKVYNLPMSLGYSLGAMGDPAWPAAARAAWDLPAHRPDAVLCELGENDCHALPNCTQGAGLATLRDAYVALAKRLRAAYGGAEIPLLLTLSSHEAGQSAAMAAAIGVLRGEGFARVSLLNATVPDVAPDGSFIGNGCAGHPSQAQNALAFARARPVLAEVLGW